MNACESLYVAAGFREDCIKLISEFEKSETCKFQNFCQIWNTMKFSCVFAGRATRSELIEFAEEALDIAKEFIAPDKSLQIKIGGIYLLYGLFFTMPVSQPKIRMILTEWDNVIKLQCQLYQMKQYDAVFILKQLIDKDAFAYCLSEHERGLENYYLLKDFMRGNSRVTQSQRKENEWTYIFDDIATKSQLYLNEKEKLSKFFEHLVPKVFDMTKAQQLLDTIKKLDNADYRSSSLSPRSHDRMHQQLININSPTGNSPSTSTDIDSYPLKVKLDSGDDSDTSEESDDEEQYQ